MSDDLRDVFDSFIKASGRMSALAQLRDMKRECDNTDRRVCGNCDHWMKSRQCPKEKNVNGYSKGPSCNGIACDQFILKPWVIDLKNRRLAEVNERAAELGIS